MASFLANILTGGAAGRADSITGADTRFTDIFGAAFKSAPAWVQSGTTIHSAYRSNEVQSRLWEDALKKYGSAEAARKWVAPPGSSQHNKGRAFDLTYSSDAVKKWWHDNAGSKGLLFPMGNEPWHIEAIGGRAWSGGAASASTNIAPVPATRSFQNVLTDLGGNTYGGWNPPTGNAPLSIDIGGAGILPNLPADMAGSAPAGIGGEQVTVEAGANVGDVVTTGIQGGLIGFGDWALGALTDPLFRILFVILGLLFLAAGLMIISRNPPEVAA